MKALIASILLSDVVKDLPKHETNRCYRSIEKLLQAALPV